MLFAEEASSPWWVTLIVALVTLVGGGAGSIGLYEKWLQYKRSTSRDQITDYQKLVDTLEAMRDRMYSANEKIVVDMNATLVENLRLKAMVGDKDALIASLQKRLTDDKH